MKITRRSFLLLALAALVSAPLAAADSKYLPAGTPDAVTLLAPPPEPGSVEQAADLESAFRVYRARTPAERATGAEETKLTIFHFAPVIGPWFVPGKFPKVEALFKEVEAETKEVTDLGKNHWKRLRPYHADPERFTDPIERKAATDYSYPSGHSTRGTVFSFILAELFPDKRAALLAEGREIGWLRVLGGVHYPTDIYAGRVLGQALARDFLASPAFQADLAAARAEVAAAR